MYIFCAQNLLCIKVLQSQQEKDKWGLKKTILKETPSRYKSLFRRLKLRPAGLFKRLLIFVNVAW